MHGVHKRLTGRQLLAECLRVPFLTLKVVAGIHYEALKLWLKGARYHPIPPAPEPVSLRDVG